MNAHKIFAEGSILDSDFVYVLAFQLFILALLFAPLICLVYVLVKRYGSRIQPWQKILIILVVPFAFIMIAGLITQALGF